MIIGNSKDRIARFSFLMVLIPVIGANLLELLSGDFTTANSSFLVIITGFITAFVSGYIACKWMISLVRNSRMIWFSVYCFLIAVISILFG